MVINSEFNKLDTAEFKLAEFLNKFKNKAMELCGYLSYRLDMEPCNGNHTIVLKIDGRSFYIEKYKDRCNKIDIDIEKLISALKFPETVIIEFNNYKYPYATMYVYYDEDTCDNMEYFIGMPNSNHTLESMIEDIVKLWRI